MNRRAKVKAALAVLLACALGAGSADAPGNGPLARLPDMPQPRAGHSASLLPDGRVLLAGGCHAEGCEEGISGSATLFDPKTRAFTTTGALLIARVGHRTVPLRNGRVVVMGGWTPAGASNMVEIYEPATGKFSRQGRLLETRDGFSATALGNGSILVVGGYQGTMQRLASAELYDPRTGISRAVGPLASPRMAHTATLLADGRVLVAGGSSASGQLSDRLELFDPTTHRFSAAGRLHKARHKHAAVRIGRDVLVLGGAGTNEYTQQFRDTERWTPGASRTTRGPAMADGRYKFLDAVVRLDDGRILVAGSGPTLELLDAKSSGFRTAGGAALDGELSFTTTTLLHDGRVLIAGGYSPDIHPSRSAWLYQPEN